MITTFFGPHSFGGDAVYVERLSEALLRKGHSVEVIYCHDAYELIRGRSSLREYHPPDGLKIHKLKSRTGAFSPLWTHQVGGPGPKKSRIRRILRTGRFDVIHFHNLSLVGGPSLLTIPVRRPTLKIMSAHEHWLLCPLSLFWKFNREVCEEKSCVACTLHGGRPPQWWRYTGKIARAVRQLDMLIFPSSHTMEIHRKWGIAGVNMAKLPYFLPETWVSGPEGMSQSADTTSRPYFLTAGRVVKGKGFQDVIPRMRDFPEMDLIIAGDGPYEKTLRQMAGEVSNVRFAGLLGFRELKNLYAGARAVIVPSLFYETFGYVVAEALAMGTPVIVRNRGSLSELLAESEGGLIFDSADELAAAMRSLARDDALRRRLAENGRSAVCARWTEKKHLDLYTDLIHEARQ